VTDEQIISPSGALTSGRVTPAVFPFYTTGEDNLRIVSFNAAGNVQLRLVARLLGRDGRPSPSQWFHTPNSDRSAKSNDFNLSGQTLLNVTVSANSGAPLIGQCFVIVQLIRGLGAAAIVVGTILSGFVTATQALGFPGSPIQAATDGQGYLRLITGATPAAGSDIVETVPTGARWQLVSFHTTLTTSASVGNRTPQTRTMSPLVEVFRSANSNNIAASFTAHVTLAPNVGYGFNPTQLYMTIPTPQDSVLLAGAQIQVICPGLAAGDQWSAPNYVVREWLDV
jgi:hypothetical protein